MSGDPDLREAAPEPRGGRVGHPEPPGAHFRAGARWGAAALGDKTPGPALREGQEDLTLEGMS